MNDLESRIVKGNAARILALLVGRANSEEGYLAEIRNAADTLLTGRVWTIEESNTCDRDNDGTPLGRRIPAIARNLIESGDGL